MANQESAIVFDQARAASYDKRAAALAPMRDALYFLMRLLLSDLPSHAHLLCVGAGTGAELIYLAQNFPQWRFTAVEPAAPMLDVCRQKVEECGVASRCTFHQGYLDSLPPSDAFDAATCILVSHFIMQPDERSNLFRQIAARLQPHAYLVSADLTAEMNAPKYTPLITLWSRVLKYADVPETEIATVLAAFGRDVALLPPAQVETIITNGGFESPVLFFQSLLIHAWFAQRSA